MRKQASERTHNVCTVHPMAHKARDVAKASEKGIRRKAAAGGCKRAGQRAGRWAARKRVGVKDADCPTGGDSAAIRPQGESAKRGDSFAKRSCATAHKEAQPGPVGQSGSGRRPDADTHGLASGGSGAKMCSLSTFYAARPPRASRISRLKPRVRCPRLEKTCSPRRTG